MRDFEQIKLESLYKEVRHKQINENLDVMGVTLGQDFMTQVIPSWVAIGTSALALILGSQHMDKIKTFLNNFVTKYAIKKLEKNPEFEKLVRQRTFSKDNKERAELTTKIYEIMLDTFTNSKFLSSVPPKNRQDIVNAFRAKISESSNK